MKKIVLIMVLLTSFEVKAQLQGGVLFGRTCYGNFETELDMNLETCLNDSITVVGDCNCYKKISKDWNIEIKKHLDIIRRNLSEHPSAIEKFNKSQELWEKYKDVQIEAAYDYYRNFCQSRAGLFDYNMILVDIYRDRDIDLIIYIRNMNLK